MKKRKIDPKIPAPTENRKRKLIHDENKKTSPLKSIHLSQNINAAPKGFIWDSENYSCAYDALFTILYCIWIENPLEWTQRLSSINEILSNLVLGFEQEYRKQITLENIRDNIRHVLHNEYPDLFPYNYIGTDIYDLANIVLKSDIVISTSYRNCLQCNYESNLM